MSKSFIFMPHGLSSVSGRTICLCCLEDCRSRVVCELNDICCHGFSFRIHDGSEFHYVVGID